MYMKLLPSRRVLCTPYNHAPCHFMQSHIRKVYACLAVTCHLHFWQNDRGLLRATAVTREWNGYRNKSQHRKLTLEKTILPPLLQGFEPATFQSRVRHSNHWAIRASRVSFCWSLMKSPKLRLIRLGLFFCNRKIPPFFLCWQFCLPKRPVFVFFFCFALLLSFVLLLLLLLLNKNWESYF